MNSKREDAPAWERRYARKLFITDTIIVLLSVFGAQVIRFGFISTELEIQLADQNQFVLVYTVVSLTLIVAWLAGLMVGDTRDPKIFGYGSDEYRAVIRSTLMVFGLFAILSFSFKLEVGRGYLLVALPIGLGLLLISRWLWRKRLHRWRERYSHVYRTLVVGDPDKSAHIAAEISKNKYAGFGLVGAVTKSGNDGELLPGLPVVADYDGLLAAAVEHQVDTLIITSADSISPKRMRSIGWELERRGIDMIVTVALTDIAGQRIHTRPIAGLPLIHVEHPRFTGRKLFVKRMFDLIVSALILLVLSPLLLVLALLVRLGSRGPVFFLQERVGLDGRRFKMWKFRSMVADAEDRLPGLLDQSDGNGMLFKLKNDPRVTPVGAVLRKYSLDELPQLFNVLRGEMSLVGPRPPLPREVDQYADFEQRRLMVKPGITGLWQVSGRSNLSWDDSVRLDLYYVENWSMVGDMLILMRTVKTVLMPEGAY